MTNNEIAFNITYSATLGPALGLVAGIVTGLTSLVKKIYACILKIKLSHAPDDQKIHLQKKIHHNELVSEEYQRLCCICLISAIPFVGLMLAQNYIVRPRHYVIQG